MQVVLSIAGSDCSGGAGIQADLKTFEAFGVFGTSVITVLTAQNTMGVQDISSVKTEFIKTQLESVFQDFKVSSIKIGMLFSNEIIDIVREFIQPLQIPIVLDPVFISKAGSKLLSSDAIENMKTLLPYCALATPNLFEAKELFNYDSENFEIIQEFSCPVVIKNHIKKVEDSLYSVDILYKNKERTLFESPFLETRNTHGTGCSFSSAIAANLALGKSVEDAIKLSKEFIYLAIKNAPDLGSGKGPIAHRKAANILKIN